MSTNPAPFIEGNLALKFVPASKFPVERRKPRFSIASSRDEHSTPPSALAVETDGTIYSKNLDREFSERRDLVARIGRNDPIGRLAAFLAVAAHQNRNEGFGGFEIADTMNCAFVADLLGFSIEELAQTLLHLQSEGIVRSLPGGGLRIIDLAELERLADDGLSTANAKEGPAASKTQAEIEADLTPTQTPRCYARATVPVSIEESDASIRFGVASAVLTACICVAFAITSGVVAL